jgi:hypothetical protein
MAVSNILDLHKTLVYDRPGNLSTKVVELPTPESVPGEILVRMYVACIRRTLFPWTVLIVTIVSTPAYVTQI